MNLLQMLGSIVCLILHVTDTDSFPKPLSKAEETKAINEMMDGSDEAKKLLIERNLRLVAHIVKKYYANYNDQDDLISIGTIGLIKGVNSFKNNKGVKLSTYCARCIENEILMYFRSTKKQAQDISFSDPIETDSEGNPLTLMEIIAVDDTIIDDIDIKNKLLKLVNILKSMPSSRDKEIIIKRYGLNGEKPKTQYEISKELNISRSYVSRIEKRVLNDMRALF